MSTFAVIGGGVSGMAAARMLAGAKPLSGPAPEPALPHGVPPSGRTRVVLIEASSRLGGKVLTSDDGEAAFDTGPDQFLRRDPSAENWCRRLGLGDDLVEPAARRAGVFSYGRSRELPPSLVLGIPTEPLRAGDTGAVSAAGCWRGELDRVLPGRILAEGELGLDETADASLELPAGTILRRRLGDELVDRLADPLLGGINAGSLDRLSLGTIAPRVAEALVGRRDLLEPLSALARAQSPAGTSSPFYGLRGGLGRLIERAGAELSGLGVEVRSRVAVTALEKTPGGYGLTLSDGEHLEVHGVVLAVPPAVAARLLGGVAPLAARLLGEIAAAGVAVATFGFRAGGECLDGLPVSWSGVIVPRVEGLMTTAVTFLSRKWPVQAVRSGAGVGSGGAGRAGAGGDAEALVRIRCSCGRLGDERAAAFDDDELCQLLSLELGLVAGITATPSTRHLQRWPDSFPQYAPGYNSRLSSLKAALGQLRRLGLAGAVLGGIGIPSCVASGERAGLSVAQEPDL